MATTNPKVLVLEAFLDFIERFTALKESTLVTLGGQGIEARLWQDAGISAENGWLVERNRSSRLKLIRSDLPYRHSDRLHPFAKKLMAIRGSKAAIDALHADFCGTIETNVGEITPLIPLIGRSSGRCLAITVADQRSNLTVENKADGLSFLRSQLSDATLSSLLEQLHAEQGLIPRNPELPAFFKRPDPHKGALRELGVLQAVLQLLLQNKRLLMPTLIERYIYVSRWSGHPFRMRSFFLHFDNSTAALRSRLPAITVDCWQRSPLFFAGETITCLRRESVAEKEPCVYEKLSQLVNMVGGEVKAEFDLLLARASKSFSADVKLEEIRKLLGSEDTPDVLAVTKVHTLSKSRVGGNGQSVKVQLLLLDGAAKGGAGLKKAYDAAFKELGIGRRKNKKRTVGGLLARTQGKFRGEFVAKALQHSTSKDADLTRLASYYSRLGDKKVTREQLLNEAKPYSS